MPDRLRAAFSPARLLGDLANGFSYWKHASFIGIFCCYFDQRERSSVNIKSLPGRKPLFHRDDKT